MQKWLVLAALTAACGDDGGTSQSDAAVGSADAAPDAVVCVPAGTTQILYLNKNGGTFNAGTPEDAATNTSPQFSQQTTLEAWPRTNFDAIKACITARLASFNVDVVDVDPGNVDHHEIVFTTQYWDSGVPASSVQSTSGNGCGTPNKRSLSFIFGAFSGDDAAAECELAIGQFASASTGLDHALDCHDYLGIYPAACGAKTFVDSAVSCGESTARNCSCTSMPKQNSFQRMHELFGTRCP